MDARKLLEILHVTERLKNTMRHSWTSQGRRESVAEHSWRMVVMAWFLRDEFPEADWEKVLSMAALHDLGEAFTGDIPAFVKTDADREVEGDRMERWCDDLPVPYGEELRDLFREMEALETLESKIVKALDKLEVLIQHNETNIATWLPLEYELNRTYGNQYVAFSEVMQELRREVLKDTDEKIAGGEKERTSCFMTTERLILREMTHDDIPALKAILQDPITMKAYEHAFSDAEVEMWLENQLYRYREYGFGLWAVVEKSTGEMIGQCGLTMQPVEEREVLEIGYLFRRDKWHCGYATEAAVACKQYAFDVVGASEVFSIIRDTNHASQAVARRNGMEVRGEFIKHYYGIDMPHLLFSVKKA